MKLVELQTIMGEQIRSLVDVAMGDEERKKEQEKAEYVAKLAKQMINNADVILRSEKLVAEGRL